MTIQKNYGVVLPRDTVSVSLGDRVSEKGKKEEQEAGRA